MYNPPRLRTFVAILCSAMLLIGCSGKAERIAAHLKRGEEYYQASDAEKALLEVRNVLQMDPKNEAALYLAGQVEESRGEFQRAYGNYSKALDIDPRDANAQAALARLYFSVGDLVKAQSTVDAALSKSPDNAEALVVQAALLSRAGHVDEAIEKAHAIQFNGVPPPSATLLLANLYASQHKDPDGLKIVESALAADPKNLRLLISAAELSARLNDSDKAVGYFTRGTQLAPKNEELWRAWADFYDKNQKFDDAERVLRNAIQAEPEDSKRYILLSEYLYSRRGKDVGMKELQSQAQARPRDYDIQFALARAYARLGQIDKARATLEAIVTNDKTGPASLNARDLLAQDAVSRGQIVDARRLLDEVLKENPRDGTALTLRGQIELSHGEYAGAIADLRSAQKDRPDSARIVGLLAAAHLANKEPELARSAIADTVKLYPASAELALLQANFLARTGDRAAALDALNALLRVAPKNTAAYESKAGILLAQNDAAGAEATYKEFVKQSGGDSNSVLLLGKFYLTQKRYSDALSQFDLVAKVAPDAFEPRYEAVTALVQGKRYAEATARVEKDISTNPKEPSNYQMLGEIKLLQNDPAAAEVAFSREIELDPKAIKGYVELGRAQLQSNNGVGALATLEKGIAANPNETRLYAAEADFLIKTGKVDDAIAIYDRLLKVAPDDDLASNNLAFLLTQYKSDKPSLDRALALTERFVGSENPAYLDSLGWVRYKLGQLDAAVPILQEAVNLQPQAPLMQLHLGMALYKEGFLEKAKEHLKIAAESNQPLPELDEARKILAQS